MPPGPQTQSLEGAVDAVYFHDDDSGFSICRVLVKGRSEPVTVRGHAATINPGENLTASGSWVDDPNYGLQFQATEVHTTPPSSKKGLERFLASDLIEGVGKKYAKAIVDKFGDDVFDILDHSSKRLEEVDGIGKKRRLTIKNSWEEQKGIRKIMVFLHEQGISTARAVRIHKQYGDAAIDILNTNPYQLSKDMWGIGFKSADQIAHNLGIAPDSEQRRAAGIFHALRTASEQGHSTLPENELLAQTAELLGLAPDLITPALNDLVQSKELIRESPAGDSLVYLPDLHHAEVDVATLIRRLAHTPPDYPEIDTEKALHWVQQKAALELAPQQQRAVADALVHRALIITGGPGVGKTTILRCVLDILSTKKIKPVLCAPTGRAAKKLSEATGHDAATIHRLLEYQPAHGFVRDPQHPLSGDLFIMDESSMVDIVLMRHFLRALPPNAHLILVGDVDQLPSVGPGNLLRDLIASETVPTVRLTEIYRQAADSEIIQAAHEINTGCVPACLASSKPNPNADFFFIERSEPEAIADTILTLITDRLPNHFHLDPARDIQVLTPMHRGPLGTATLNQRLQSALNPPREYVAEIDRFGVTYRTGDKLIQNRNNYDKDVFNGDIGFIDRIDTNPTKLRLHFDDQHSAAYDPSELDELQHAYAITIHKSQGSEFPAVVIPVSTQHFVMLQRNLLYTGLTRGKKIVVLVGDPKALEIAIRTTQSTNRHSGLLPRLTKLV